jgi:hypothetical protein
VLVLPRIFRRTTPRAKKGIVEGANYHALISENPRRVASDLPGPDRMCPGSPEQYKPLTDAIQIPAFQPPTQNELV